MKKLVLVALTGSVLTLQAGLFDSFIGGTEQKSAPKSEGVTQNSGSLISELTGSLGVTPQQAAGGTAALLQAASKRMPSSNYGELLKSVPGLGSIAESKNGMVGGAMNMLGGGDSVSAAFKALGMESSMIGKFIPLILDYAGKYATKENVSLLKSALSAVN